MCQPLGENDVARLNVKVWEGGQVSKRGKMSHRENKSQYRKRDVVKQMGKLSQSECFIIIQV
jgi:hypothetical protein